MGHEDISDVCSLGGGQDFLCLKRRIHDDAVIRFLANQYKDIVAEVPDTNGLNDYGPGVCRFHEIAFS
jgi:hypothetical protein